MSTFENILKSYEKLKSKEDFLVDIEKQFDESSWDDIKDVVDEADIYYQKLGSKEEIIENIIGYVTEHKRITFKQWKILRMFISNSKHKPRKFKYEK